MDRSCQEKDITHYTHRVSEVVKRNKKASKVEGSFTKEASRHSVRNQPAAIVIDAGSEKDFSALALKIKSRISVGNNITGMRMTKKGSLLLEVRGDQDALDSVRSEVTRAAGTGANVRQLQQRTMLEIRDIDTWSDRGDIVDSIVNEASGKERHGECSQSQKCIWQISDSTCPIAYQPG